MNEMAKRRSDCHHEGRMSLVWPAMLPVSLVVLHLKECLGDFTPSEDIGNDYVFLVIKNGGVLLVSRG